MTLGKKLLTGAGWTTSSVYLNAIISFIGNIFLARLLVPDDFGVFTLATSFLSLLFMIAGFGSQEAIVQCRDETIKDLIPTAFWMTICLGLILAVAGSILGVGLIPASGKTMGTLIVLLSWFNLLSMISSAYGAILNRELVYSSMAMTQTAGNLLSFGVAVILAFNNWGIWSLFAREAVWNVFVLGGYAWASGYRLTLRFDMNAARWIWKFGWKLFGNRTGDVLFERFDKLMIGNFLGTPILGQYSIAYRLALVGHQFVYGIIHSVVFSAFAAVQKEAAKLQLLLEKLYYIMFRLVLLLGLLVWFCGSNLVILIYGTKWQTAGSIFQNMAVFLVVLPLDASLRVFLIASGNIDAALKIRGRQLLFFIPVIVLAAIEGDIFWVVWSVNAGILVSWLLAIWQTTQVISIRWGYLMQKPVLAAGVAFIFMTAVKYTGLLTNGGVVEVFLDGFFVVFIMLFALYGMERKSLHAEWNMIQSRLRSD